MMQGNIGEWSEFYAFLKVLVDRKLVAADADLNPIPERYSDIKKVTREDSLAGGKVYDFKDGETVRVSDRNGLLLRSVSSDSLKRSVSEILGRMKSAKATTFSVPGIDAIADDLLCKSLKASSRSKADLFLVMHDRLAPVDIELGFSIKSRLGAPATLLNAGRATNFIFEILSKSDMKSNEIIDRVRDRVSSLEKIAGRLVFAGMENEKFKDNLSKIDSFFPEILAEIVRAFYAQKGNTIKELCESVDFSVIGASRGVNVSRENAIYKIKHFLVAVALGMTPGQRWSGNTEAQGGYIVVKEDGELVCYHLYNRDEFQDYLYENTKLETPSTTRHRFGIPFIEDGKRFIKLNLQIRFNR